MANEGQVPFEEFRSAWVEDIRAGDPTSIELGRRFALKVVSQWLDTSDTQGDIVYCDGSGDGGIDLAILDTGPDSTTDEPEESGHSWYLVQSKFGAAFQGAGTLLVEGQKVIETLDGRRQRLNSLAEGLLARLQNFRNGAGPADKIVLVFATEANLDEGERRALNDLRVMGRERLGAMFDVETVSVETIYARLQDEVQAGQDKLSLVLKGALVASGNGLLVGSVALNDLYSFLRSYRELTGDLDQIYEKNVRRFLGGRGKVNRAMQATLRDAPERFGLYNNGITIVVADYAEQADGFKLVEPYVVNGCQTSRTIWEVFHQRVASGGTGINPEIEAWKERASSGVVVLKIVKVGDVGETLLQAITRYTNSQNAVREKDFIALTGDFKSWQKEMSDRFGVYLEIQRGGWDSQRALQNSNPSTLQYTKTANAADLVKAFGAGWMNEAGLAFGKNPPFLPDGSVFKRLVNNTDDETEEPFGATDLFAAYLLQQRANEYEFGRGARPSRRQTRFLFYMVTVDLLRDAISRMGSSPSRREVSRGMIKVLSDDTARGALMDQAIEVIDTYMTPSSEESLFQEPAFLEGFNSDVNAFLKWEKLGKSEESTPRLRTALAMNKSLMGRASGGHKSPREIIQETIRTKPLE